MKAVDEYFLMVVFTLLLNRVHDLQILCLIWTEKRGSERVKKSETIQIRCSPFPRQMAQKWFLNLDWYLGDNR